jgi:LexA-binding, inner membrane-associated putative hydrolase
MMFKTHLLFATPAVLIPLYYGAQVEQIVPYAVGVMFGTALPDIDEPNSSISRNLPFLMVLFFVVKYTLNLVIFILTLGIFSDMRRHLNRSLEHRGITHYVLTALIILVVSFVLNGYMAQFVFGLSFGWLLHEIGDAQTKPGILNWTFPFFTGRRFWVLPKGLRYEVGGNAEAIVAFGLTGLNLYIADSIVSHRYGFSFIEKFLELLQK